MQRDLTSLRRPLAHLGIAAVALTLTACSASRTGHLAIAMDPAGRLLAVVALCDNQRLGSLTLTDETTGASTTVRPNDSPPRGGAVILTGPIADPHPEGLFDLLDRGHTYTLAGATKGTDSEDETGTFAVVRFKLDDVVREPKLREASVLAPNEDGGAALTETDAFVSRAGQDCA